MPVLFTIHSAAAINKGPVFFAQTFRHPQRTLSHGLCERKGELLSLSARSVKPPCAAVEAYEPFVSTTGGDPLQILAFENSPFAQGQAQGCLRLGPLLEVVARATQFYCRNYSRAATVFFYFYSSRTISNDRHCLFEKDLESLLVCFHVCLHVLVHGSSISMLHLSHVSCHTRVEIFLASGVASHGASGFMQKAGNSGIWEK